MELTRGTAPTARAVAKDILKQHVKSLAFHYDGDPLLEAIAAALAAAVQAERERLIRQIARECRHIRSGDPLWRILGDPQQRTGNTTRPEGGGAMSAADA